MIIQKLEVKSFKGIKEQVSIEPQSTLFQVCGMNGAGKSSVLNAIAAAVDGKNSCPDKPIHGDEEEASITLELVEWNANKNDYEKWGTVERKFKNGKTSLKVIGHDGIELKSPQALLDMMKGAYNFNPIKFVELGDTAKGRREQMDILKSAMGITKEFDELSEKRELLYDTRKNEKANMEAFEKNIGEIDPKLPEALFDITEASKKYNNARNYEIKRVSEKTKLDSLAKEVLGLVEKMKQMEKEIADKRAILDEDIKKDSEIVVGESSEKLLELLNNAQELNHKIAENNARKEKKLKVKDMNKSVLALTKDLEAIEKEKEKLLKTNKMPIPDLIFKSDGLVLGGIPFNDCNTSLKIKTGIMVSMALNKGLKVIIIPDGTNIDSKRLNEIKELAEKEGYQIWVERVGEPVELSGEKSYIMIEEGEEISLEKFIELREKEKNVSTQELPY